LGKMGVFRWISEGSVRVGSIAHYVGQGDWASLGEWDMEVTEFMENNKIAMKTVGESKIIASYLLDFEPTSKGTKVKFVRDFYISRSELGKLLDKLKASREWENKNRKLLENLKKALES
jgi:hypothetical protein